MYACTPAQVHGAKASTAFFEHGQLEATDNLRVRRIRPLMPAAVCIEEQEAESTIRHLGIYIYIDIYIHMRQRERFAI